MAEENQNKPIDLPAEMFRPVTGTKKIKIQMYKAIENALVNEDAIYGEVGSIALFEGDIALGTLEEIKLANKSPNAKGCGIANKNFRWHTNGDNRVEIPYIISSDIVELVQSAIAHWETYTPIRFKQLNGESDHINFERIDGCWSFIGKRGGRQDISVGNTCSLGSVIHEIGHCIGLWHEHTREDRDNYIEVLMQNVREDQKHNFNKHILDGDDLGKYDFSSIMHYPPDAFSKNKQPTIKAKNGHPIGQRNGLSAGDIESVKLLYPHLDW